MICDFGLVIMVGCALLYYRIGSNMEHQKGFLLGAISIGTWMLTTYVFSWEWFGSLSAQAAIFILLMVVNGWQRS